MKITSLDVPSSFQDVDKIPEELPEGVQIEELMPGLKFWRNPINGFYVMRLHRSADPRKRTKEWEAETRKGLDLAEWLREYELIWEALEGKPVYADHWSQEFHASRTPLSWQRALPVCRGWDFGLNPACLFTQLFPHSRLMVIREMVGIDIDTERFIDEVNRLSADWFPDATFYEFIDPTGVYRAGTDGRSYANLLGAKPLRARRIILGANAPAARRGSVIDFLKGNVKGTACLLVDPSCETLIKGFGGGYFYAYQKGTLRVKPEKNHPYSDIHDCLQYVCSRVLKVDMKLSDSYKPKVREPGFLTQIAKERSVVT